MTIQTSQIRAAIRSTLRPPPRLTLSEWADSTRRLSPEDSAEPGQWRTGRAEYQRGIMDAVTDARNRVVVMMMAAQVGKTQVMNNVVGYHIDRDPCPLLVVQPTLEMGHAWSKDRLAPMIRDTPTLRGRVKDPRARDSGNTLLHKRFPGGHLTISGANSPASLASRPVRKVLLDEVDRFPPSAGSEGDPVTLAYRRTTAFWNKQMVLCSTPTVKGISRIESAYEESDKRVFLVPCKDCGQYMELTWERVVWDTEGEGQAKEHKPETAAIVCGNPDCGVIWTDADRYRAISKGFWEATAEFHGTAGFFLNALYSPWLKLEEIVREFLEAKGKPERLKTFVNTMLGQTWEDQGETVGGGPLYERREPYAGVAEGVKILTGGVDVQDDRFEIQVIGWGVGQEAWVVDYQVIYGDPSTVQIWQDLDDYLTKSFADTGPAKARFLQAVGVDTGGHHTQAAYDFCRGKHGRRVWALKGMAGPDRPIWPWKPSKNNIGKINLWTVGVDAAKESLYARLRQAEPGPGYIHFPLDLTPDYFDQLTAEKAVTKYFKGFPRREWRLPDHKRNEALDTFVYAYAALSGLIQMGLDLDGQAAATAGGGGSNSPAPTPTGRPRRRKRRIRRR